VQGYVLAGWNNALADVMPATDLTYEARWTAADDTAFTVEHYIQNANDDGYTKIDTVIEQGTTNSEVNGEDFKKTFDNAAFEKADVNTVNADGSTVIIGTLTTEAEPETPKYTNVLKTSVGTDGQP
jgi:hypothetical protein